MEDPRIQRSLQVLFSELEDVRKKYKIKAMDIREIMDIDMRSVSTLRTKLAIGKTRTELRSILIYIYSMYKTKNYGGGMQEVLIPVNIGKTFHGGKKPIVLSFQEVIELRRKSMPIKHFAKLLDYTEYNCLYTREKMWMNFDAFPTYGVFLKFCMHLDVDVVKFSFEEIELLKSKLSRKWKEDKDDRVRRCGNSR